MIEIWKDIPSYEGYYQASNLGKIKSLKRIIMRKDGKPYLQKEQLLKPGRNRKGYLHCNLTKNFKQTNISVHRLVAITFIDNPNNLPQINHIDGNKENNSVDNLEWISNYDNMQHSIITGIRNVKKITDNLKKVNSRKVNQYDLDGNFIKAWDSIKDIQMELKIPNQNISKVCQGKRKKAHNYIFKYADVETIG